MCFPTNPRKFMMKHTWVNISSSVRCMPGSKLTGQKAAIIRTPIPIYHLRQVDPSFVFLQTMDIYEAHIDERWLFYPGHIRLKTGWTKGQPNTMERHTKLIFKTRRVKFPLVFPTNHGNLLWTRCDCAMAILPWPIRLETAWATVFTKFTGQQNTHGYSKPSLHDNI